VGISFHGVCDAGAGFSFFCRLEDGRALLAAPERHLRCNPTQAQFIVAEEFAPVQVDGPFDKRQLDADDVRAREELITRGWRRLQEVAGLGVPISEYPLPEVRNKKG
jgi:hypothetical protein